MVASDIPGYREVMSAEAGVLVPPDDADALEAVLGVLADEHAGAGSARGARLAEREFSWDGIARRLDEIYGALAGREQTPAAA